MSSTNRGTVRNEVDFYVTPDETIEKILYELAWCHGTEILEPCAGNGAIVRALKHKPTKYIVTAVEIRNSETENLFKAGADHVYCGIDFLKMSKLNPKPEVIITNPPYSIAQEIIEHCFEIAPDAEIIMLLRLGFLGSKKRKSFWGKHPVTQLYPLGQRPSFTGKGTDSADYAWFVWSKYRKPLIKPI